MHRLSFLSLLLNAGSAVAWYQPSDTPDLNLAPVQPQDTICGDIVSANLYNNEIYYYASDVIECLTSVEFLPDVATRFIKYFSENAEFQSTIGALSNPPDGYRQPAVDFAAGLQQIQDNINNAVYKNQYTFEADLQALVNQVHDGHFMVNAGILNQFTFGSPYDIVSVSKDGREAPQIYLETDLYDCVGESECNASPVESINGVPVIDYLTEFAVNQSYGYLEPNADWNNLMTSPALEIIGGIALFGGAAGIYPGNYLNFTHENGTETNTYWLALYNSPGYTGPLATGGDFYNFFVLGQLPASYNYTDYLASIGALDDSDSSDDTGVSTNDTDPGLTSWNNISIAYPSDTLTHQDDLGLFMPGIITGYLLEDIDTAVISIPTFDEYGDGVISFQSAVKDFINKASNASKLIIDLQQNYGGQVGLALDTYQQFFPNNLPFTGSRMRAQPYADALGNTFTSKYADPSIDSDTYDSLVGSEWVVTDRINAETGQNFTSWPQYFGPLAENGDSFTLTQQYNLSSVIFDSDALGFYFDDGSFNTSLRQNSAPWHPEDIVILTDGLCASSCSLFVEMMVSVKGVRTVVVGGRPEPGPMQATGGTRGAASYDSYSLDTDINNATAINQTAGSVLPARGDNPDTGMYINYLGYTIRDQIRQNATVANQFLYLPADCRIYWSFANWYNYTQLWNDAYNGIYGDTSICVPGSVNVAASTPLNTTSVERRDIMAEHILQGLGIVLTPSSDKFEGLTDDTRGGSDANSLTPCLNPATNGPDQSKCIVGQCKQVQTDCNQCTRGPTGVESCRANQVKEFLCLSSCATTNVQGANCGPGTHCISSGRRNSATQASSRSGLRSVGSLAPKNNVNGLCIPVPNSIDTPSCDSLKKRSMNLFESPERKTSWR